MTCLFKAVWFDLDGTLMDTANDLAAAINACIYDAGYPTAAAETIKRHINEGAKSMLSAALACERSDTIIETLLTKFPPYYEANLCDKTAWFDGMEKIVTRLENDNIPWGVVTNKAERYSIPLIKKLGLDKRVAALVCGDTTAKTKPSPQPLLFACQQVGINPDKCIFIGDSSNDIQAGNEAGMVTVAAGYGYLDSGKQISDWQADYIIEQANELTEILWRADD
ncbi:MAG: phosphoglycolate phosphatase [Cardiobacteriales bacterium]|nr:MAG: phosphoglycolate phosphatase [Cardiobacteriales bacterium]